ncbi:flavodoxin reductase Hmp [Mycobacterium xenopi RIVM700367]|nr:flavodoxin reductase Hmp [Mycobacterium xenopi RIVM700367]
MAMAELHAFQQATVARVIKETADTRTFVLVPHQEPFFYRAGQYCTFRVRVDGRELCRSYSMSSAPETDPQLMTTVKRVPGGKVSNWLVDNVAEGDELTMTRAAGTFCLQPTSVPLLAFAGGSGITPILSLAKSALATTDRVVRVLCADRDRESVIFGEVMDELAERYAGRLSVLRHIDAEQGLIDADAVRDWVGSDVDADNYVCGPEGFMAVVRSALPGPGRVFVEDFDIAPTIKPPPVGEEPEAAGTVTIYLERKKVSVPRVAGETLLETARRAGLTPPFSCEQGNCGTCMARLTEGHATMRANDALTDDEVEDGYILTCQGVPDTPSVTVRYE